MKAKVHIPTTGFTNDPGAPSVNVHHHPHERASSSTTSQLPSDHLLSHGTATAPCSCLVQCFTAGLHMTFSKQPSSAVTSIISFKGG